MFSPTGKSMGRTGHTTSDPAPRETGEVPLGWELGGSRMDPGNIGGLKRYDVGVKRWSWEKVKSAVAQ